MSNTSIQTRGDAVTVAGEEGMQAFIMGGMNDLSSQGKVGEKKNKYFLNLLI